MIVSLKIPIAVSRPLFRCTATLPSLIPDVESRQDRSLKTQGSKAMEQAPQVSSKEYVLLFSCPVNDKTAHTFMGYLVNILHESPDKLTIAMNSGGGDVVSGIAMYNCIRSMPYKIVTHNFGNVDSIAVVIFLGADERYASAASTFMFHGVAFDSAEERLDETNLLAKLDNVNADHQRIGRLLEQRSTLGTDKGIELFKQQKFRDAAWAKENGFIREIKELSIPAHAIVNTLFE